MMRAMVMDRRAFLVSCDDADLDKLPADAARPGPPVPGDPMTDPADAAQFLDVEVDELPRLGLFIPPRPA
jgi:hypothetical protein